MDNNVGVSWTNFPNEWRAPNPDPELSPAERAARVVRLGANCTLNDANQPRSDAQSFRVSEFAVLDTGRRVRLHDERGVTIGTPTGAVRDGLTADDVVRATLGAVLPDEDNGEEHPWDWLAELARARGLDTTAGQLRDLPYEVELDESVTRWLASP